LEDPLASPVPALGRADSVLRTARRARTIAGSPVCPRSGASFPICAGGVRSSPLRVLLVALSSRLVRSHEAHQSASQVSQLYLHTPSWIRRPHSPSHFSPSPFGGPLRAKVRVWPAVHVGGGNPSRSPIPCPVHGMQMSTSHAVPQQLIRSSPLGMTLWHGPLHRIESAVSAPLDRWRKWPMVHFGRSHRCVSGPAEAVGRVSPSCVSGLWETFLAAWMAAFVVACEARLLRPTAADWAALAASATFACVALSSILAVRASARLRLPAALASRFRLQASRLSARTCSLASLSVLAASSTRLVRSGS
jgi:hypothetical protein